MKISIVGLGKMGSLVQKTAQEENIEIASSIDPHQKDDQIFQKLMKNLCMEQMFVFVLHNPLLR